MLHYPIFWNVLCVVVFFCIDSTVTKSVSANSIPKSESLKGNFSSTTNVALSSEGGPLPSDTIGLTLLQGNYTIPTTSKDAGKNKVVPRKGVVYSEADQKSQEISLSPSTENTTNKLSTSGDRPNIENEAAKKPINEISYQGKNIPVNKTKGTTETNKLKIIETPKKPLVLEATKLENMTIKPIMVKSQLQPLKNSYLTNPNSPGLVMPIVITILLVPMFAVLGYMALRRGQEAWKNRHYKRMDFLLDGMYND